MSVLYLDDLPLPPQRPAAELPQGVKLVDCITGGKAGKMPVPIPGAIFDKDEKYVIGNAERFIARNSVGRLYVPPFPGFRGRPKEWPSKKSIPALQYLRDIMYIGNGKYICLTFGMFNDWAAPLLRDSDCRFSYSTDLEYFNLAYGVMNVNGRMFNDWLYRDVVELSRKLCVAVHKFDPAAYSLDADYRVTRPIVDEMYGRCVKYGGWALCALQVMAQMTYGMVAEEYFVRNNGQPTMMGMLMKLRGFKKLHDNPGNPGIVAVASDCDRHDGWAYLAADTLLTSPELLTERCVTWHDGVFRMARDRLELEARDEAEVALKQGLVDRATVVSRVGPPSVQPIV